MFKPLGIRRLCKLEPLGHWKSFRIKVFVLTAENVKKWTRSVYRSLMFHHQLLTTVLISSEAYTSIEIILNVWTIVETEFQKALSFKISLTSHLKSKTESQIKYFIIISEKVETICGNSFPHLSHPCFVYRPLSNQHCTLVQCKLYNWCFNCDYFLKPFWGSCLKTSDQLCVFCKFNT